MERVEFTYEYNEDRRKMIVFLWFGGRALDGTSITQIGFFDRCWRLAQIETRDADAVDFTTDQTIRSSLA